MKRAKQPRHLSIEEIRNRLWLAVIHNQPAKQRLLRKKLREEGRRVLADLRRQLAA